MENDSAQTMNPFSHQTATRTRALAITVSQFLKTKATGHL